MDQQTLLYLAFGSPSDASGIFDELRADTSGLSPDMNSLTSADVHPTESEKRPRQRNATKTGSGSPSTFKFMNTINRMWYDGH